MSDNPSDVGSREERLNEVLFGYLRAVEAGQAPNRQELLTRHPDLAADLGQFFAEQERFDRAVAPLRGVAQAAAAGAGGNGDAGGAGAATAEAVAVAGVLGDFRIIREVGRGGMGWCTRRSRCRWGGEWR